MTLLTVVPLGRSLRDRREPRRARRLSQPVATDRGCRTILDATGTTSPRTGSRHDCAAARPRTRCSHRRRDRRRTGRSGARRRARRRRPPGAGSHPRLPPRPGPRAAAAGRRTPRRRGRPRRHRPAAGRGAGRRAGRAGRRAGPAPARPGAGPHLRGARAGCAAPGRRPAAGAAPGDDLHRPPGRPDPAARHRVRGDHAGRPAPVRHPAGRRPGRDRRVGRRLGPPALPRGPGARRQPPGHAGQRGRRAAAAGGGTRSAAAAGTAAAGGAGQRALAGRPGADRAGRPRRRRHDHRPPAGAGSHRTRVGAGLPGAGPPHRGPGDRARPAVPGRRGPAAGRARRPAPGAGAGAGGGGHQPGPDVTGSGPAVTRTRAELAAARDGGGGSVAVVMTLGALHEGHAALLAAARTEADRLVATIFVNPLQFGPGEDYQRYPRTFDADLARCRQAGVDLVFAPPTEELYPHGEPAVRVDPGPVGRILEGASRPGHFAGVLTVVLKLLQLTRPDLAYFGEKDYQQLVLIRTMVRDLDIPVRVRAVPTVREPDGLARSSRNRYLSGGARDAARSLSEALRAGVAAAAGGAGPEAVRDAAAATLRGVELDYLALTDPRLRPLAEPLGTDAGPVVPVPADRVARLLVAGWVDATRLIDNTELQFAGGER
ncbi:MAG: pantoate--beta-alanine ligase [Micromonosporaceae bacterium]|nr:pantoate--beta-alanine ligase [Micromonosporaceae bacterium]